MTIRTVGYGMLLGALLISAHAWSAGGGGGDSTPFTPADPVLERVAEASERKDWAGAAAILEQALARSPDKADYHNLYAYSLRKGANPDMDRVFRHYGEALRLDPDHRGAHEYAGEAYLMVGNLAKAREHLAALDRICFLPCKEYTDLKREIAEYEKKGGR